MGCYKVEHSAGMLVYRKAAQDDIFDILKLYSEFNQEEPCAKALGLASCANPSIAESLAQLAESGKILLCCEEEDRTVLGMGVFYTQKCEGWSVEDIEGFCEKKGFLELCPTFALSSTAVGVERIGKAWGVEEITYLEMLVTTIMARGRGVAGGIVKAVEEA